MPDTNTTEVPTGISVTPSEIATVVVATIGIPLNLLALYKFMRLRKIVTCDIYCIAITIVDMLELSSWIAFEYTNFMSALWNLEYFIIDSAIEYFLLSSWLLNTALAVARYYAINRPYDFKIKFSKKKVLVQLTIIMIAAIPPASFQFVFLTGNVPLYVSLSLIMPVSFITCAILIVFIYLKNVAQLRAMQQRMNTGITQVDAENTRNPGFKPLEKMFVWIAIFFLLFNVPANILSIALYFLTLANEWHMYYIKSLYIVQNWIFVLQALSNIADPLIYVYFRPEFRVNLKCGGICTSSNTPEPCLNKAL